MDFIYEAVRDNIKKFVELKRTYGFSAHFHNAVEILIVLSGKIELGLNGKTYFLGNGDIVLCDSYDIHSFTIIEKDSIGNVIIIPKGLLDEYYVGIRNKKFAENIVRNPECFEQSVFLYNLIDSHYKKKPQDLYLINSFAQSLFALIAGYLSLSDKTGAESDIMKDVLLYLREHYTENINLSSISKRFGYTKNYFSNLFNSYMRVNLSTYINSLRVEKSASLIKNGKSITNAALDAGFLSLRTFYRCFKEIYGDVPSHYKYFKTN